jgi:hypothetical protein
LARSCEQEVWHVIWWYGGESSLAVTASGCLHPPTTTSILLPDWHHLPSPVLGRTYKSPSYPGASFSVARHSFAVVTLTHQPFTQPKAKGSQRSAPRPTESAEQPKGGGSEGREGRRSQAGIIRLQSCRRHLCATVPAFRGQPGPDRSLAVRAFGIGGVWVVLPSHHHHRCLCCARIGTTAS